MLGPNWEDIAYAGYANIASISANNQMLKNATDMVKDAAASPPSHLPNILLVDADGADDDTKSVYEGRKEYIYQSGVFHKKYSELVGQDEATKEKFLSELKDSKLKLVSVGGHGDDDCVYGYIASGDDNPMPILSTTDVKNNKKLATGKIFHFLACDTANKLGPELVKNGAIAFIL